MKTMKDAAKSALLAQSAPNLSGVVHGFSRAMEVLCEHEPDMVRRRYHPVSVLFATQIAFLTGVSSINADTDAYEAAYKACEELAR